MSDETTVAPEEAATTTAEAEAPERARAPEQRPPRPRRAICPT